LLIIPWGVELRVYQFAAVSVNTMLDMNAEIRTPVANVMLTPMLSASGRMIGTVIAKTPS